MPRSFQILDQLAVGLASLATFSVPAQAKDALSTYADIAQFAIPGTAGAISIARKDGEGFLQLGIGSGITYGVTRAFKFGINSERPNGGDHSFPSGHTSGAFSGASYLHYRYGWKWGLPAYVAASVVGYSRVRDDDHYWYDVVGGAVIANAIAYALTDRIDEKIVIIPIINVGKHDFGLLARIRV
jgi:membrane-associated phospholipid phosphatase